MASSSRSMVFSFIGKDKSLGKTLHGVSKNADHAHGSLSKLGKAAIGLGAALGAGLATKKILDFGKHSVNAFTSAAKAAGAMQRIIGGSAEDASRLGFAASQVGVDMEVLTKGLGILSKNLVNAKDKQKQVTTSVQVATGAWKKQTTVIKDANGHFRTVSKMVPVMRIDKLSKSLTVVNPLFERLGFTVRDAKGEMLPMSEILGKLADRFKNMENGPEKSALALKLFGRQGLALIPLLNKGSKGIAEFAAEADKLGLTMSGKDVKAVKEYTAQQRYMKAAFQGLKITLGREFFPIFTAWSRMLAENSPKLVAYAREHLPAIQGAVRKVSDAITLRLMPAVAKFVDGFARGTGSGGSVRSVIEGVASAAAGFASAAGPFFRFLGAHPGLLTRIAKDAVILAAAMKAMAVAKGIGALAGIGAVGKGGAVASVATLAKPLPVFVTNQGFGTGGAPVPGSRVSGGGTVPPVIPMGPKVPKIGAPGLGGALLGLAGAGAGVVIPDFQAYLDSTLSDMQRLLVAVAREASKAGISTADLNKELAKTKDANGTIGADASGTLDFFKKYADVSDTAHDSASRFAHDPSFRNELRQQREAAKQHQVAMDDLVSGGILPLAAGLRRTADEARGASAYVGRLQAGLERLPAVKGITLKVATQMDAMGWKLMQTGGTLYVQGRLGKMPLADNVPHGATGAIVRRPTLALIGERGAEAVVPLNQTAGNSPLPAMGGGGDIWIHSVTYLDGKVIAENTRRHNADWSRRGGDAGTYRR